MSLFDETIKKDGPPGGLLCDRCGRYCEPLEIEVCPICKKNFCIYCIYRVGSRNYCSRACGDSYFFGSDDDADNLPDD